MSRARLLTLAAFAVLLLAPAPASAQFKAITQPPSGDNQRASVTQGIGLATVRIDYSSPDVHGPDGTDRKGKIWGALVPYGLSDLGYNDCKSCPWRAGANENTVFTVSHDVKIEGQELKAGAYGLHMIPDPNEWTVIFSKNSTAWGSYWYDPADDALRVKVKPHAAPYKEWLTYEFTDRKSDRATVELQWEELAVPIQITLDGMPALYMAKMREELKNAAAFSWVNWEAAAQHALTNNLDLAEGLRWAHKAIDDPFAGQANFTTLTTLAQLEIANGKEAEAKRTIDRALAQPELNVIQVHTFGRQLQAQGKKTHAMQVFQANARKFPGKWPTALGLARGYSDLGDRRNALSWARKALAQAPNGPNKANVENFIKTLEAPATQAAAN